VIVVPWEMIMITVAERRSKVEMVLLRERERRWEDDGE
jgi:hypothetical protein